MRRISLILFSIVVVVHSWGLLTNRICAATRTYQFGGVDNEWFNAANWSPNGLPAADDMLTVDTAGPNTVTTVEVKNGGTVVVEGSGVTAGFSQMEIGYEGEGEVTIEDGAVVTGFITRLGEQSGSLGIATVTGVDSHWDLSGGLTVGNGNEAIGSVGVLDQGLVTSAQFLSVAPIAGSSGDLYIEDAMVTSSGFIDAGSRGAGLIELASGGALTSTNTLRVGNFSTGFGTVLVDDSTISVKSLTIGGEGEGSLEASGGAVVTATGASSGDILRVGDVVDSVGDITLTGPGTLFDLSLQSAQIGNRGEGTVEVFDGAEFRSSSGFLGVFGAGSDGSALISDPNSRWTITNSLEIGREGSGLLEILGGGSVSADGAIVGSAATGTGLLAVSGATSELSLTNFLFVGNSGAGRVELTDGGKISSTTTFVEAMGTLEGQGTNSGTLQSRGLVSPGLSAGTITVEGAYLQLSTGTLEIELGGTTAGTEYDVLQATLSAQLDGFLDLSLIGTFAPTETDTFEILTAQSITGSFVNAPSGGQVSTTDGLAQFTIHYGAGSPFDTNKVVLTDFFFDADVDRDGDVDGVDFLLIQADPGLHGLIPVWEASYGRQASPLSATIAQVPEPTSAMFLIVASLMFLCLRF